MYIGGSKQLVKTLINIVICGEIQSEVIILKNNNYKPKEFAKLINVSVRTL